MKFNLNHSTFILKSDKLQISSTIFQTLHTIQYIVCPMIKKISQYALFTFSFECNAKIRVEKSNQIWIIISLFCSWIYKVSKAFYRRDFAHFSNGGKKWHKTFSLRLKVKIFDYFVCSDPNPKKCYFGLKNAENVFKNNLLKMLKSSKKSIFPLRIFGTSSKICFFFFFYLIIIAKVLQSVQIVQTW